MRVTPGHIHQVEAGNSGVSERQAASPQASCCGARAASPWRSLSRLGGSLAEGKRRGPGKAPALPLENGAELLVIQKRVPPRAQIVPKEFPRGFFSLRGWRVPNTRPAQRRDAAWEPGTSLLLVRSGKILRGVLFLGGFFSIRTRIVLTLVRSVPARSPL